MNNRIALQNARASMRVHHSIVHSGLLARGWQSRLKKGLLLVVLLTLLAVSPPSTPAVQAATVQMDTHWGEMPLYFIANQGQMDSRVAYYVQGSDKTLYFTPEGVTFALTGPAASDTSSGGALPRSPDERDRGGERWVVKLDFVDANPVSPGGEAETDAVISYFKGPPGEWHTGLPTYSRIVYQDLWEGIDLAYSGTFNRLKHEYIVQPGADPRRIRLAYRGATVHVTEAGGLQVSTPAGGFQDDAPVAYQEIKGQRVPVPVEFALENSAPSGLDGSRGYGFQVGAYDPAFPLVIDPAMLVYCGYIGGSGGDFGTGIAVDSAGNAYVTGYTESTEATFPVTVGPDLTHNDNGINGLMDAFVAKVKADGTGLVYAGYIGGDYYDYGSAIAVDPDGNAYITGHTESTEATFPVTVGPDLTFNNEFGYRDAFVAKVNPDGTGLVYAGYIGGSAHDSGEAIAVDPAGNAYVTGDTGSTQATFPVIGGPDLTRSGIFDAFVAKVKADGTGLIYAGYIGGSGLEAGYGIAVDLQGSAYVTGWTTSTEATFPVTGGPGLTYGGGSLDAFVAKVKTDGTGFAYAGYIGGSDYDEGRGIAVDLLGHAYVAGFTISTQATFPVAVGPDLTYNGGTGDAFVAKVKTDGTGLVYAGYIGGSSSPTSNGFDEGADIAVDLAGGAYVTGGTDSSQATFPVIGGPDLTHNGYRDAYVAKVKADGTGLVYAGYIGGIRGDSSGGIAVTTAGDAYIMGDTDSTQATFPVIVGPDLTYNDGSDGGYDAFVAKISYRERQSLPFSSTAAYDGWVLESAEASNKGSARNATATTFNLGDNAADKQYRAILSFDTSGLPDSAVITKATLKIKRQGIVGTNPFNTHSGLKVDIRKPYFGAAAGLAISDFQAAANKSAVATFNKTPATGAWYSAVLGAAAYPYIDLAGTTQFRLRFAKDDNDDLSADYLKFYSGNAGAAYRPVLVVEYYVP